MSQSPVLWTAHELAALFGGAVSGQWEAHGVSIDSRSLQAGDLFVALSGDTHDGHDYVAAAFEAGAVAALVRDDYDRSEDKEKPLVRVPDVLAALETMARAARARSKAYIIAVTGSVGKTGTKEILAAALAKSGPTHAAVKSFNNHIGVPLTLARLPQSADYGIFEIGMNHAGEIAALVNMVRPHCAIVTTIGVAHIENFPDMEALAAAKAEVFGGLEKGGTAIIPIDAPHADILCKAAKQAKAQSVRFSTENQKIETFVGNMRLHDACSCVVATIMGHAVTYKLGLPGHHHVSNSLAALSAVVAAGGDLAMAALSLADRHDLDGRGRRHHLRASDGAYLLIDESYNANPTSMQAAVTALGLIPRARQGRRIAVLGDMAELGATGRQWHESLAADIEAADIDLVLTCGRLMKHLQAQIPPERSGPHSTTTKALLDVLLADIHAGDVVMVKGSNATGMVDIVNALLAAHADTSSTENTSKKRESRHAV